VIEIVADKPDLGPDGFFGNCLSSPFRLCALPVYPGDLAGLFPLSYEHPAYFPVLSISERDGEADEQDHRDDVRRPRASADSALCGRERAHEEERARRP
jgi:hypothetical protein